MEAKKVAGPAPRDFLVLGAMGKIPAPNTSRLETHILTRKETQSRRSIHQACSKSRSRNTGIGYPARHTTQMARTAHRERRQHPRREQPSQITDKRKRQKVDYFFDHSRCFTRTRSVLGYPFAELPPSRSDELEPEHKKDVLDNRFR